MKIMYKEDAEEQEDFNLSLFLTLMNNEVERLEKLPKHDNIIQLIEYDWKGVMTKSKGSSKEVLYCVIELAPGGDLFDYIFTVDRGFPENIARYYFTKLIDSIEFMHDQNVVHRDLKLENLLLDADYNLKIADFGLSTTMESSCENGVMYTRVGTERYMPPEMLEKSSYVGPQADLFSAGIILFVLIFGIMPTHRKAESNDYLYKYVRKKEYEKYWTIIAKLLNLDLSNISEDFFHLVTTMIKYNHKKRLNIAEIKDHPWMKGPIATEEEVKEELSKRKQEIKQKLGQSGEDQEMEDVATFEEAFDEIQRGVEDEFEEEAKERSIGIYSPGCDKVTEFFSTYKPDVLLGALVNFCKDKQIKFELHPSKYKATVELASEEENIVNMKVKIEKVVNKSDAQSGQNNGEDSENEGEDGEQLYCMSLRKKKGPQADFLQIYRNLRWFCKNLNNAEN